MDSGIGNVSPIFTLPPELLEQVIILLSQDSTSGSHSISALSKTSKHFYYVIYHPAAPRTDHHLWREIFLKSFDDARSALNRHSQVFHSGDEEETEEEEFDWEEEYKARILSSRVLMSSSPSDADSSLTLKSLRTIERILETSLPFPLGTTITITFGNNQTSSSNSNSDSTTPPSQINWSEYPAFPPLVLLLASKPSHIKATYRRPSEDDEDHPLLGPYREGDGTASFDLEHGENGFHHVFESENCLWVEKQLGTNGYPLRLTRRIMGDSNIFPHLVFRPSDLDAKGDWDRSEEGRIFCKLVAFTGFLPIPKPASYDADLAAVTSEREDDSGGSGNLPETTTQQGASAFFTFPEDDDMVDPEYADADGAGGRESSLSASDAQVPDEMDDGDSSAHDATVVIAPALDDGVTRDLDADMNPADRDDSDLPHQYEPIPINPPHEPSTDDDDNDDDTESHTPPSPPPASTSPIRFPTREEQFTSARKWARRVVYDLKCLVRDRGYGPFMSLKVPNSNEGPKVGRNDVEADEDEDEDGDDDFDALIPFVHLLGPHLLGHHDLPNPSPSSQEDYDIDPCSPNSISTQLKPDWTWLAAARIVVEANLQDMLFRSNVNPNLQPPDEGGDAQNGLNQVLEQAGEALRRMEGLRMGGAPNYWNLWKGKDEGKGKSKELTEESWDWDWAGVTGIWRSVCL